MRNLLFSTPEPKSLVHVALLFCGMALVASLAVSPTLALAQDEAATEEAVTEEAVTEEAAPAVEEAVVEAETPAAEAEAEPTPVEALRSGVDVLWTCLAAFLVFFMQAGFCLVEAGFTRAKNACNIVMKNLMDFSIGTLIFWLIGFGLMFGANKGGFFGLDNFMFDAGGDAFGWAFLIFQTVFAATAATIVSGAMAERTKFIGYLFYTVGITAIVYPVFGSWAWGNLWHGDGWLTREGVLNTPFIDFAGSTVVHSIGGWAALAGALVLGPRLGKYTKDGRIKPIPGHNIPLAALGVFILWMGWFGFNPGSTTALGTGEFARVAVTTNLAAAAGCCSAMIAAWVAFGKPDVSFALNGALAGLVGITAGCYNTTGPGAALIGLVAGVLVVGSCVFFDRIRIDDPVGAVSVHGVCGAWGTLAVGLWGVNWEAGIATGIGVFNGGGATQLVSQVIGVSAAFVWSFFVSLGIFLAIKATVGIRVTEAEEMEGLDIGEHGMAAYPPNWIHDSPTGAIAAASYAQSGEAGSGVAATPKPQQA